MANEFYTQHVQPSLGDRAVSTGKTVIEKSSEFVRHADEAVDMAPPAASVWLALIVGLATYRVASSLSRNVGPRDGAMRLVRGAACICAAWMMGSCAHDNFLESKGYAINGKEQKYEQISTSPRAADFEKASRPRKRTYDYAPHYNGESAGIGTAPARGRDSQPDAAPSERRHNKPIARPE